MIEERLQEVFDWKIMQFLNNLEQEQKQFYDFEELAAMEYLSVTQDDIEQSHQIQISRTLGPEQDSTQGISPNNTDHTHVNDTQSRLTPRSLDSIVYQMEPLQ